ncbi:MAG: NADH-quinone oxidoreductase subunit C [Candidatus Altiarchaeota archaeon]
MSGLSDEFTGLCGGKKCSIRLGCNNEVYATVSEEGFHDVIPSLSNAGYNLISLFCVECFNDRKGFTLLYAFEKRGEREILVIERQLDDAKATSIEESYPTACWYEREIRDGFGIEFEGAFEERRLFLHEAYPDGFHPLLKSFRNQRIRAKTHISPEEEYRFKDVSGEEVYQIPVGPVHAGIIEPGHFRFSVIGENIYNLEVRMFYKHRGVEKLSEGRAPEDVLPIAESISGDETVANAVCFCNCVEKISGISVPARACYLRTLLLEMERIYSHLGDLAGMVVDVAYPAGASPYFMLREEILRQNDALTGSRFMRGIIGIGGLQKDIERGRFSALSHYLEGFTEGFKDATEHILSSPSVIDRFERTGVVRKELIAPLNLSGPIARASGGCMDTRTDHPYGIYERLSHHVRVCETGDVMARFNLKAQEIHDSVTIIHKILKQMPDGEINAECDVKDGHALSIVEAPRGQSVHWVSVSGGLVDRYKVRTASFCNWQAIEHAVMGNIIPDFPLINKSMNLSYAGCDL